VLSQGYTDTHLRALLRLAAVLKLVGSTGKASAILAKASQPTASPFPVESDTLLWHHDALYVTQLRIGDKAAAEATLRQLLEAGPSTYAAITPAAVELAELGFLTEARQIAALIVTAARHDDAGMSPNLAHAYAIYAAVLAKDPGLANEILQEDLGPWLRFKLTLDQTRMLAAAGREAEAKVALSDLVQAQISQGQPGSTPDKLTFCLLPAIAHEEAALGFDPSATATRHESFTMAMETRDALQRATHLTALAASFPRARPATLDLALSCMEHPA
jgi:hypothetical protein